jgi:hypothetical protein
MKQSESTTLGPHPDLTFPVEVYTINLKWPITDILHLVIVTVNGSSVGSLIPDEETITTSQPESSLLIFFDIIDIAVIDLVIISNESGFGNSLIFKNVEVTKALVRRGNKNISCCVAEDFVHQARGNRTFL